MPVQMMHPASTQEIEVADSTVPMYESQGWRVKENDAPAPNAVKADWVQYARTRGFSDSDLEGMTIADIRAALA